MRRGFLVGAGAAAVLAALAGCIGIVGDFPVGEVSPGQDGSAMDGATSDGPVQPHDGSMPSEAAAADAADGGGSQPDADAGPVTNPHQIVQITTGIGATTCARTLDGLVYCWGANSAGQVGDGTLVDRTQAVQVTKDSTGAAFANIAEISAGGAHVCARDKYRYYYCWGDDDFAQLADGRYNMDGGMLDGGFGAVRSQLPVKLSLRGDGPVAIVAGGFHSCVIDDPQLDAGLNTECWGSNLSGELGHDPGTDTDYMANAGFMFNVNPVPLGANSVHRDITQLSLGLFYGCYLRADRSVWCWGTNNSDVLGNPTGSASTVPVQVHGPGNVGYLTGMLEVSAHAQLHACARDTTVTGNVWCWGDNNYGQLGTGATIGTGAASPPVQVQVTNVTQIAVANDFTCAVVAPQGTVACWGSNSSNQLGHSNLGDQTCTGGSTPCDPNPTYVGTSPEGGAPLAGVVQVSMGTEFACALKNDGTVWCWGNGANGRLGNGDTTTSSVPVQVKGLP